MEFGRELQDGDQEQNGGESSTKKAIALEITAPNNGESQMWDVYPVTPLKVNVSNKKFINFYTDILAQLPCTGIACTCMVFIFHADYMWSNANCSSIEAIIGKQLNQVL